jgi:Family of unknown function (DUF5995)
MIRTIGDVIVRMRAIGDLLDPADGLGQFNAVYLRVTETIRDRLGGDFFNNPAFVEHFDVVFANRYFAAVDADAAGQPVDPAWRPLFNSRLNPRIHAVQFVVAGMNAHINHDLPLATIDACGTTGTHPGAGTIADDYRKINDVLEEIEAPIRLSLLSDLPGEFDELVEPLVHLISSWSIVQAREAAWAQTQVLWILRAEPWLFDHSMIISSKAVGMTSHHLLTPLLPAHPRDELSDLDRAGSFGASA